MKNDKLSVASLAVSVLCLILLVIIAIKPANKSVGAFISSGTNFTDVEITNDLLVDGQTTFTGTSTFSGVSVYGSKQQVMSSGSFADATTTLFCVLNPFNATSTVNFAKAMISGASTSTVSLYYGTSTVSTGNSTSTVGGTLSIIQVSSLTANTTGVAFNNINNAITGVYAAGSVASMVVGSSQYVCGVVGEDSGSTAGVTNTNNTFAGSYVLQWVK